MKQELQNLATDFDDVLLTNLAVDNTDEKIKELLTGDECDADFNEEDFNVDPSESKTIDQIIYEDFEKKLSQQNDFFLDENDEDDLLNLSVSLEQVVHDYQQGCTEAFDYLFNHYRPKLERLSFRQNNQELFPELSEVLWRAAKAFDNTCGAKFNTYYWKCARNHMGTLNIRKTAQKRTAKNGVVSLEKPILDSNGESETEIGHLIEDKKCSNHFDNNLFNIFLESNIYPHLKQNEILAIKMLLDGYTLEEIGQELGGITAPAVHVKLRRLSEKKIVGKQLKQLYEMY